MTRSRIVLISLGLIVVSVSGVGAYLYQRLPEIIRQQAQRALQQYGVEEFEFTGLQIHNREASVDTLQLRGTYEHLTYQARLTSGELHFDWRTLFSGKINSLSAASVNVSITQTASSDSPQPDLITVDEWLPQRWIAQLPSRSLRIEQWTLNYSTPNAPTINAVGSLLIDRHLDLQLTTTLAGRQLLAGLRSADDGAEDFNLDISLHEDQSDIANLSARLARAADHGWEWTARGQAQYAPLLLWLREPDIRQVLALDIPASTDLALQGESRFTASVYHTNTLDVTAARQSDDALLRQLKARFHLSNEIRQLDIRHVAEQVNGRLDLDVILKDAQFEGSLQPFKIAGNLSTQRLLLPDGWQGWMRWGETLPLQLEATEPVPFTFGKDSNWALQVHNASLSLGDQETRLRLQKLNLNLDTQARGPEQASAKMQFSASVGARLQKQALPQLELAFTQQGTFGHSDFTLQLADTTESFRADLQGTVNLASGSGDYQLKAQIADLPYFTASTLPLLQHFKLLQHEVTLDSGTLSLATALHSKDFDVTHWDQRSQLSLSNVSGSVDDYSFAGLDVTADWSGISRWKTLQAMKVSLASLNTGFAMQDIRLQLSLPKSTAIAQPQVRIDAFSASMFSGQLSLPQSQVWDFGAATNQLTLSARGWQLGDLVRLQKNADIRAQGTLDGELPLTVTDGRIIIDNGYLHALPPGGSIRYHADEKTRALAASNAEIALALDLLSDFQYQVMRSDVQLDKAGKLLLALTLEGSNPAQYDGQLIHFNINVEQNLDPLLQSLRLSGNLVKRIEGGLQ